MQAQRLGGSRLTGCHIENCWPEAVWIDGGADLRYNATGRHTVRYKRKLRGP